MARELGPFAQRAHGSTLLAGEPLVFHCNFYNYWLQKTLLLDDTMGMAGVIHDAAAAQAYALVSTTADALGATEPSAIAGLANHAFAELGFGTIDLSAVSDAGGIVTVPVSHYGRCLRQAAGVDFARPQTYFDAGFAAGAVAAMYRLTGDHFVGDVESCQSMGAVAGRVVVRKRDRDGYLSAVSRRSHTEDLPPAPAHSNVDEAGILRALSGLDLSGNEEGLIPRFGVMLTNHFANFYNRISFEFVRQMDGNGLLDAGEMLLTDAGHRCAFHTFGGVMSSPEWAAVVEPQCNEPFDWVHGMVATVNALGWGVWRVVELTEDQLVVRIWDDYESCGWLDMYGPASRPVSHLAAAGVAGLMNLLLVGDIAGKPELDYDYYVRVFESADRFVGRQTKSIAMGDAYTEVIAERDRRK